MPELLDTSPADVLKHALVYLGLASFVAEKKEWPAYLDYLPNKPDNCVVVFNTAGMKNGRLMRTGEVIEHPGAQIRVRASKQADGWTKMRELTLALDKRGVDGVAGKEVVISGKTYVIQNASRTSTPVSLGEDGAEETRFGYSLNVLLTILEIN